MHLLRLTVNVALEINLELLPQKKEYFKLCRLICFFFL